jgi:hypothetical protein
MFRATDHCGDVLETIAPSPADFSGHGDDGRPPKVTAHGSLRRAWEGPMASLYPSAAASCPCDAPDLLALADLKWVMSAYVERIDIARLLRDSAYARRCLDEAHATPSELVHKLAERVLTPLL